MELPDILTAQSLANYDAAPTTAVCRCTDLGTGPRRRSVAVHVRDRRTNLERRASRRVAFLVRSYSRLESATGRESA